MKRLESREGGVLASLVASAHGEERGVALILVLFVIFALGMMLFSFAFMTQSELGFAGLNRSSVEALNLAEAGAQEAIQRININGLPSSPPTTFTNSLASTTPGATGTVTFQPNMLAAPSLMPVTSVATFAGIQRKVRVLINTNPNPWQYQLYGYQVNFDGNTTPTTGNDIYSSGTVEFENWPFSPLCAAGASRTNLISPQIMGAAFIYAESPAANQVPPCGAPNNAGTYFSECQDLNSYLTSIQKGIAPSPPEPTGAIWGYFSEVAPTSCLADGKSAISNEAGGFTFLPLSVPENIPVNWHPMSPQGMNATDFLTVVNAWANGKGAAMLPVAGGPTLNVMAATQTNTAGTKATVTYSPAYYVPQYYTNYPALTGWSGVTQKGNLMLIAAMQPFCVIGTPTNPPPAGSVYLATMTNPGPYCPTGGNYYGYNGGTANSGGGSSDDVGTLPIPGRFVDWGIVSDDIARAVPSTFFGTGQQNGIRYIPKYSQTSIASYACQKIVNGGHAVYDNLVAAVPLTCPAPTVNVSSTTQTFDGSQANPEAMIIANGPPGNGMQVTLSFTSAPSAPAPGSPPACLTTAQFNSGNWGVILASGDLVLNGSFIFSGFIFAQGNVAMGGGSQNMWLQGGIMTQPTTTPPTGGIMNLNNKSSFVGLCGGLPPSLGSPLFGNFAPVTWEDVPLTVPGMANP